MRKNSAQDNLVTKKDLLTALRKYSTKTDLKNVERSLRREILRVEERVEKTEETLIDKIREMKDDLMNKIDSFGGKTEALEQENTVGVHHTRELRVQIDNHETRITKLESTPSAR